VLVVARFVRRRVTLPLEQCAEAVSRVGAGDRDVRLPTASDHEFAELAEAFNAMSSRLAETRADLETRNTSLSEALGQVRTTQDELVRSETLSAIGRMTAGLAHELNNPLATVLASSELLAARLREGGAGHMAHGAAAGAQPPAVCPAGRQ
jgi:two-component system, NtrC family, sensor kinase